MTQLKDNIFAVEVPDKGQNFRVQRPYKTSAMCLYYKYGIEEQWNYIKLPPGTWLLICTTSEASEEIAASIVKIISNGKISGMPQYRRYDRDPVKDTPAKCWTRDSRHALETLITSKGLDGRKNYCLIKKL